MNAPSTLILKFGQDSVFKLNLLTDLTSAVASSSQPDDCHWTRLTETLEAFSLAWTKSPFPPSIVEFLPESDSSFRRMLILELIKLDLELRWQKGLRRIVEDYLDDLPELSTLITADLVFEEYHIRKTAGDLVSSSECFRRFPSISRELDALFRMDPALQSTALRQTTAGTAIQLNPGDTIDDFDVLLRLGQGAFATVFLARQKSMQRMVALKISTDQGLEPQTLALLDHDNIIRVYDQRLLPAESMRVPMRLLYMQYAAGGTLQDVIHRLKTVPAVNWNGETYLRAIDSLLDDRGECRPAESEIRRRIAGMTWPQVVCWIGVQLARALDYAHRAGVLHRDIKPANVLLTAEGVPKLADFNISFGTTVEGANAADSLGGSLAYMSPEQLEACCIQHWRTAAELDGRSDLFSLGVVICELMTGRRPFAEDQQKAWSTSLEAMIEQRRQGLSDSGLRILGDADDCGLGEVIVRCLQPSPEDRFASGAALANAIDLCLQPEARQLLCDTSSRWKKIVVEWPLTSIVMATLIPNGIAAVFNFLYNRSEVQTLIPDADSTFMRIQSMINLIVFPIGILSAGWVAGSVARATRTDIQSRMTSDVLAAQRHRCLQLGNAASLVGLTLWLIAAPAYPVLLHLIRGNVPVAIYVHFLASLALCGLIAAAYPFFAVSLMSLRCFYPALVRWELMSANDLPGMRRLARVSWFHLVLAASVPMLAVAVLALSGLDRRFALIALAVGGVPGFALAVTAFRLVQQDLQVLIRVIERRFP